MFVSHLWLFLLIIFLPNVIVIAKNATCVDDFVYMNKTKIDNYTTYCKDGNKACIQKCCSGSLTKVVYMYRKKRKIAKECLEIEEIRNITKTNFTIDYSLIQVYENNYGKNKERKSNMSLSETYFKFIWNKKLAPKSCGNTVYPKNMDNYLILENASLVIEKPNFYERFMKTWDNKDYCVDHAVNNTPDGIKISYYITYSRAIEDESSDAEFKFKRIAMATSCVFLLLLLIVYALLQELRNLPGMILMAYVATHFLAFIFKFIQLVWVQNLTEEQCKAMSVVLYFLILSLFFWMNIMSLDLWWTFRGIFKSRSIHRRGQIVKFCQYALFGWGLPLLVSAVVASIDYSDLTYVPWIYKPHFELCFLIRGSIMEIRHYLYMPILALLIVNSIFFLLTIFNIWRINKQLSHFDKTDSNKYNKTRNRFFLYLKLALVMGVSWIFSVIDNLPYWIQLVATIYNSLTGVAIFMIFVFKTTVLVKLCERFSIESPYLDKYRRKSSAVSVRQSQMKRRNTTVSAISSVN